MVSLWRLPVCRIAPSVHLLNVFSLPFPRISCLVYICGRLWLVGWAIIIRWRSNKNKLIPGLSLWDLWWTKSHWDSFFSEYFHFSLYHYTSVHSYLFFYYGYFISWLVESLNSTFDLIKHESVYVTFWTLNHILKVIWNWSISSWQINECK